MKWGPQAKLIDEALLKYYLLLIYLSYLDIYLCNIQKVVKTHNITVYSFKTMCLFFNKIVIIFMAEDTILYNTILKILNNLHIYSNGLSP